MNPVSQINRKGRAEILRTSGAGFDSTETPAGAVEGTYSSFQMAASVGLDA